MKNLFIHVCLILYFTVFIILTPLMIVSAYLSLKLAKHIEKNEKDKKKKGESDKL